MITFNKFNPFVANLANKVFNFSSDQLKVALCATTHAPVAANGNLADLTEIAYTNLSSRNITTTSSTQTGGIETVIVQPLTLTATGTVATFQYVAVYDDTAGSKQLIGWFDLGTQVTLSTSNSLIINFDVVNGLLTIQ